MLRRWTVWAVMILLSACAFCTCAKPQYIVPGLTLPPGATVVSRVESVASGQIGGSASTGSKGRKSLYVRFDCPGGWDEVLRYMDQRLSRVGYKDATAGQSKPFANGDSDEGFEELNPVMTDPDAPDASGVSFNWRDNYRYYEKQGSKYKVMLQNFKAMLAAYAADSQVSGAANAFLGGGDYTLYVMEY